MHTSGKQNLTRNVSQVASHIINIFDDNPSSSEVQRGVGVLETWEKEEKEKWERELRDIAIEGKIRGSQVRN